MHDSRKTPPSEACHGNESSQQQVRAITVIDRGTPLALAAGMRTRLAILLFLGACVAPSNDAPGPSEGGKSDGTRRIVLDCNTSLGPDQQVTVLADGSSLTLRELTTAGSQVERDLDTDEWQTGVLELRDDSFGSTATLTKEDGEWFLRSTGGGFEEFGFADCWIDESP